MLTRELDIRLYDKTLGTITAIGELALNYSLELNSDYNGIPLSLAEGFDDYMNLSKNQQSKKMQIFLNNLLPEGTRSKNFGGSSFLIFYENRNETAGAIEFAELYPDKVNISDFEIDEKVIESRLENIQAKDGRDLDEKKGKSLAGEQGKLLLTKIDNKWYDFDGTIPSTHIIKPGIARIETQSANEFLSIKVAENMGYKVPETKLMSFGKMQTIVSKRYDRTGETVDTFRRIHQEDFCSCLGVKPSDKYEPPKMPTFDNEPYARRIFEFLDKYFDESILYEFADQLLFLYTIGSSDSHLKNFSVIRYEDSSLELAPLYDMDMDAQNQFRYDKFAIPIGGKSNLKGDLTADNMQQFATDGLLDTSALIDQLQSITKRLPEALEKVRDENPEAIIKPSFQPNSEYSGDWVKDTLKRMNENIVKPLGL
jgi:serine/threonine-protein kinase HipA